ncbi:hypothetical protein BWD07_02175 [Neisseria canis]|nr:hypothetical protein BWD07_02175 [Neisseria canis]
MKFSVDIFLKDAGRLNIFQAAFVLVLSLLKENPISLVKPFKIACVWAALRRFGRLALNTKEKS